jgi:hypothetical protein
MNRWRVGEDRGSKEKDRCPLTRSSTLKVINLSLYLLLSIQPLCIFFLSSFSLCRLLVGP